MPPRISSTRCIGSRVASGLTGTLFSGSSFSTTTRRPQHRSTSQVAMEDAFEAACASKVIPGAVLLSSDTHGKLSYSKAFGVRSIESHGELANELLTLDSVMYIASCTKLLTTIAALQCVERELVTLDEDVRPVVEELRDLEILRGDEEGIIVATRKNTAPITLRQLLTHQSGFSYEFNEPLLQRWRKEEGVEGGPFASTLHGRFLHPLLYEPGTSWSYGPSVDWAGVVVERLTGLSLQEYMKTYIWEPLGIRDMTFFLSTCPDMQAKVAHMTRRLRNDDPTDPEERLVYSPLQPVLAPDVQDCLGGGGIFTSPRELFKVIHAVLLASGPEAVDDGEIPPGQLLRRSTVQAMFRPQLREAGRGALQKVASIPRLNRMMGDMPVSTRKDWGLGGLLVMDDLPGWRRKGTMSWGGNPNLSWFIDPTAGLCGLYASQLMPLGDAKSVELMQLFEREIYARLTASDAE